MQPSIQVVHFSEPHRPFWHNNATFGSIDSLYSKYIVGIFPQKWHQIYGSLLRKSIDLYTIYLCM